MADSVMVRSVMRYGTLQGEWVCHDPFPKHNHSSVSLFGYFLFGFFNVYYKTQACTVDCTTVTALTKFGKKL